MARATDVLNRVRRWRKKRKRWAAARATKPMTIREAIEAMKIVVPHTSGLHVARSDFDILHTLWGRMAKEDPPGLVRLIGLMEHRGLEEVVAEYEKDRDAMTFVARLGEGFQRNPLDLLVNAAYHFGLTGEGWKHG